MLAYAMDHPAPATLILISGDRDFAYAVSILRLRRYNVVVIALPVPGAHISLKSQASLYLDWNVDVMRNSSSSLASEGRAEFSSMNRSPPHAGHNRKPSYVGVREPPFFASRLDPSPELRATRQPVFGPAEELSLEPSCGSGLRGQPGELRAPAPAYSSPNMEESMPARLVWHSTYNFISPSSPTVESGSHPAAGLFPERVSIPLNPITNSYEQSAETDTPAASITQLDTTPADEERSAFQPLVDVLEKYLAKGISRPLRLIVDRELVGSVETMYSQTGTTDFGQLISLAEHEKIIQRGGSGENAWISFHRDWLSPSTGKNPSPKKIVVASPKKIPAAFKALVDVLEKHRAKGVTRPLRSTIGFELVGLAKTVYKQDGIKNFSQLTALAEKEKIVHLGGRDGNAWISLWSD